MPVGSRAPCSPFPKITVVLSSSSVLVMNFRSFGPSPASVSASCHCTLLTKTSSVLSTPVGFGADTKVSGGCLSVNVLERLAAIAVAERFVARLAVRGFDDVAVNRDRVALVGIGRGRREQRASCGSCRRAACCRSPGAGRRSSAIRSTFTPVTPRNVRALAGHDHPAAGSQRVIESVELESPGLQHP